MGFIKETHGGGVTFFSMTHGKVRIRVPSAIEGSVERQLKSGDVVHELVNDAYEGRLVSVRKEESQWGMQWRFEFEDQGLRSVCNMNYDSVNAQKMLNVFLSPDLNFDFPVVLKPYDFMGDKGKQLSGVTIYQGGVKMLGCFATASFPVEGKQDMPELKAVKFKGKDAWDSSERLEFLEKHVDEYLIPKLGATPQPPVASIPAQAEEDGDGIPF